MRIRTFRRVLTLSLLAAFAVPVGVPTASAAPVASKVTVNDDPADASSHSGAPSPAFPAAEIVSATLAHGVDQIVLSLRFKGPSDPLDDPNIDHERSEVAWSLETDQGHSYQVRSWVEGGQHLAKLFNSNGVPVCTPPPVPTRSSPRGPPTAT